MKPGDMVRLTHKARNKGIYPASMNAKMMVFACPRNMGVYARVDVLCDDNQVRVADLSDLETDSRFYTIYKQDQ